MRHVLLPIELLPLGCLHEQGVVENPLRVQRVELDFLVSGEFEILIQIPDFPFTQLPAVAERTQGFPVAFLEFHDVLLLPVVPSLLLTGKPVAGDPGIVIRLEFHTP